MPQGTRPVRCWPSLHGRAPGRRGSGAFSTGSSSRRGRARRWPRRATDRRTGPGPVPHPPPAGSHRPLRAAVCNSPTPRGRGHGSSSRPRPPARPWCRPPSRSPPRRRRLRPRRARASVDRERCRRQRARARTPDESGKRRPDLTVSSGDRQHSRNFEQHRHNDGGSTWSRDPDLGSGHRRGARCRRDSARVRAVVYCTVTAHCDRRIGAPRATRNSELLHSNKRSKKIAAGLWRPGIHSADAAIWLMSRG